MNGNQGKADDLQDRLVDFAVGIINLAAKMPEKVKELHAKLLAWRQEVKAPMPTPNKPESTPEQKAKAKRKAQ